MLSPLPTFQFMLLRSFFCLVSLFFVYRFVLHLNPLDVKAEVLPYIAVRAVTSTIGIYLQALAMMFTDVSKVIIVFYSPFIPAVLAYVLIGEKVGRRDLALFGVAFVGTVFIMNPFGNLKGASDVFGVVLAIVAACFFSTGLIAIRKVRNQVNIWVILFYLQVSAFMAAPVLHVITEIVKK